MGNRKQRWCRLGFCQPVCVDPVRRQDTGSAPRNRMRGGSASRRGYRLGDAAHYAEAETLLTQALWEAEQGRADDARVALAANHLGLLYHDQGRLTGRNHFMRGHSAFGKRGWARSTRMWPRR